MKIHPKNILINVASNFINLIYKNYLRNYFEPHMNIFMCLSAILAFVHVHIYVCSRPSYTKIYATFQDFYAKDNPIGGGGFKLLTDRREIDFFRRNTRIRCYYSLSYSIYVYKLQNDLFDQKVKLHFNFGPGDDLLKELFINADKQDVIKLSCSFYHYSRYLILKRVDYIKDAIERLVRLEHFVSEDQSKCKVILCTQKLRHINQELSELKVKLLDNLNDIAYLGKNEEEENLSGLTCKSNKDDRTCNYIDFYGSAEDADDVLKKAVSLWLLLRGKCQNDVVVTLFDLEYFEVDKVYYDEVCKEISKRTSSGSNINTDQSREVYCNDSDSEESLCCPGKKSEGVQVGFCFEDGIGKYPSGALYCDTCGQARRALRDNSTQTYDENPIEEDINFNGEGDGNCDDYEVCDYLLYMICMIILFLFLFSLYSFCKLNIVF
jgi:hypothetical protein